jgi:hypothetical protein
VTEQGGGAAHAGTAGLISLLLPEENDLSSFSRIVFSVDTIRLVVMMLDCGLRVTMTAVSGDGLGQAG